MVFSTTRTESRENLFKWVGPIATATVGVIAKKDNYIKINSIDDLNKYKKSLDKNDVPWTPAISLVVGLQTVLKQILDEGMENVWKRHAKLAEATREAMLALNLNLLAENPSNGVTSVFLPESVDGAKFVKYLRDDLGITVAGGQEHLKGKIFRIAHMGYCNQFDMVVGISAIEEGLNQIGVDFKIGKGLSAFQKAWLK